MIILTIVSISMFDVRLKDMSQIPTSFAEALGADAWVAQVRQPLAIPWLEVVVHDEGCAEIYLLSDPESSRAFAQQIHGRDISSITCRSYSQTTEELETLELSQVVLSKDGISVRYKDSDGKLREPHWLEIDRGIMEKSCVVLFGVT